MSHKILFNASFHLKLNEIDQEFVDKAKQKGCPYCGGVLHRSNYPRSPFGMPAECREHYRERFSLCCSQCRKRVTPPSVRFFGRRRFPAALFIFISVLMLGINERRLAQIKKHFGIVVSESTWKRWRWWWREEFAQTLFLQKSKGLFIPKPIIKPFPRELLNRFKGAFQEKLCLLLKFLSPLTAGILRGV